MVYRDYRGGVKVDVEGDVIGSEWTASATFVDGVCVCVCVCALCVCMVCVYVHCVCALCVCIVWMVCFCVCLCVCVCVFLYFLNSWGELWPLSGGADFIFL